MLIFQKGVPSKLCYGLLLLGLNYISDFKFIHLHSNTAQNLISNVNVDIIRILICKVDNKIM